MVIQKSLQDTLRPLREFSHFFPHKLAEAEECASAQLQGWPACTPIVNLCTAYFADFLVK